MSVSLIQQKLPGGFGGSTTSATKTFNSNTTSGNLILVGIALATPSGGGVVGISSVTDSQSNTYNQIPGSTASIIPTNFGDLLVAWYYAINISGGACTVTVNFSTNAYNVVELYEFVGVDSANPVFGSSGTGATTSVSAGSIVANRSGGYSICLSISDSGVSTYSVGSGWTLLEKSSGGANGSGGFASEFQVVSSPTTISGSFTISSAPAGYAASVILLQPFVQDPTKFYTRPNYGGSGFSQFSNMSGGGE